ncbi:hypothetical protein TNCV_4009611 [Trichonephila clavipes]|nr:hypothetical protein TNCV_4009611 [Trichonephila clavipes]
MSYSTTAAQENQRSCSEKTEVYNDVAVVPFQQQRVCEIQLLQRFLYRFKAPSKSTAEDAELGTVRVSQQPVEMLIFTHAVDFDLLVAHQLVEISDIERSVDAELGTVLVSRSACSAFSQFDL